MSDHISLDLLIGNSGVSVEAVEEREGSRLSVRWRHDQSESLYPLIMLRDCCPCPLCFNPVVNSRLTLFEQLMSLGFKVGKLSLENGTVTIEWSDGHQSTYSSEWLYRRRLEKEGITKRLEKVYGSVVDTPWSGTTPAEIIKSGKYEDILASPDKVIEFTECLIKDGVYVIKEAPDKHCLVEFLATIGAKHQTTHYSDKQWVIQNIPGSKDLPNSSKKLELHIDMPYLKKPQQLQLLHCMIQSAEGGENKLSDALKAALTLKEQKPEYYRLLSTVEVDFQFIKSYKGSRPWFICNRAPVIQEDPVTGLPTLCRFAAEVRCSSFNQPIEVVEAWFEAFRYYWSILEANAIFVKSEPGDILAFNNGRVMHAREAFNSQQARELEGVYADWDYLMSAWRWAKTKQQQ